MDVLSKISLAFEHGGFWMWPILMIQVASIAIMIERAYALFFKRKLDQHTIAAGFEDGIRRGELDQVINKATALEATSPVAKAVIAGAKAAKFMGGKDEIQGKMDEVLVAENANLDRRTGFLSMLGNVATLTGLLGTITGMIKSFAAVSYAEPSQKAALLAAGISEAMNATAFGLIAAIPALVAYAILQNRANRLADDLNHSALKAFNWLSYSYEPVGFKSFKNHDGLGKSQPEINA
ncbi:MAG: MotA/TolQ/ExbB proton channel family protein [Bdellovibrionaceae bacterium]|nr:MotA/TolQ/ExbB proton channel family protein [Pseudobdellovibrionaceae bacterium]